MSIEIKLDIEKNDVIMDFLKESCQVKSKMIYLGYTLYNDCKKLISGWDKSDYQSQLQILQKQIDKQSNHLQNINTRHSNEISEVSQEIKERTAAKYERDIKELSMKCKSLQDELNNVRVELLKEHHIAVEDKIEGLRTQYETKLQEERDKCLKYMTVNENSSIKGQQGEEYTYNQLNLIFPKFDIEDTHSKDARGDFLVKSECCVMMVEAKQYHKNVPLVEIEKFHRDMALETNKDIQCGVLISLDSGICVKEDFHIEFIGGKPIIYLHHTRHHMYHIRLVYTLFEILLKQENLDMKIESAVTIFKNLSKKLKRNYKKQITTIDKHRAEQLNQLREQQGHITELYSQIGLNIQF
mgnify:CR=1 FL=1|tara:strand:- start:13262 stop:14326 length:1065 start_codon:yes stop_codon:yes gene_type:complete